MATRTPWSSENLARFFQYGNTFFSHCHFKRSPKSGGHGVGDQLGNLALSESPGQPEKSMIVATTNFSASRVVLRLTSALASPNFLLGWSALPWQLRALMVMPWSSSFC